MKDASLFIIPGNPPSLHFYQLRGDEIQEKYPGCALCLYYFYARTKYCIPNVIQNLAAGRFKAPKIDCYKRGLY